MGQGQARAAAGPCAPVEQRAGRRHTGGRREGLLANDAREHLCIARCVPAAATANRQVFSSGANTYGVGSTPLLLAACDAGDNQADLSVRPAGPVPCFILGACTDKLSGDRVPACRLILDGTVLVADRPLHGAVTEHCPCRAHCGPTSRDWARLR